jgi:hypothetical protein
MTWAALVLAVVGQVVFSFVDPAITESSGLVDLGPVMVTTNDSGGDPLVFVVDSRTGRTVGRTTFASEVEDVEALAPAGRDEVWVGDIGDNDARRQSVQVYRVPVGRGDRTVHAARYDLVYPDGAHDAESLVAAPTGRLYVITKGLLGGTAYAAPRHLRAERPNVLTPAGSVDVWATDAALFPDGRHVLVRGYGTAAVYTFPGFAPVASFDLPRQRQGEGVSIGRSGRVRLSSEGRNSPVLQVLLPDALRSIVEPRPPAVEQPADPVVPHEAPAAARSNAPATALVVGGTLVLAVLAGAVMVMVLRRRSRR